MMTYPRVVLTTTHIHDILKNDQNNKLPILAHIICCPDIGSHPKIFPIMTKIRKIHIFARMFVAYISPQITKFSHNDVNKHISIMAQPHISQIMADQRCPDNGRKFKLVKWHIHISVRERMNSKTIPSSTGRTYKYPTT